MFCRFAIRIEIGLTNGSMGLRALHSVSSHFIVFHRTPTLLYFIAVHQIWVVLWLAKSIRSLSGWAQCW